MLAVPSLRSNNDGNNYNNRNNKNKNNHHHDQEVCEKTSSIMESNFTIGAPGCCDEFSDFAGGNLLDSIDFDDLFMGMHDVDVDVNGGGDVLPDLEMDPELLAEFSLSGGEEDNSSGSSADINTMNINVEEVVLVGNGGDEIKKKMKDCDEKKKKNGGSDDRESDESTTTTVNSSYKEGEKGKKSSSHNNKTGSNNSSTNNNNNNNQGKRKAKVDWTPELHRRFVQVVEQLGVDKAVPSRILELMGIDCLTRHNIASHLQKYRSHRKHLLAREAEAANWTQKRQIYGVTAGGGKGGANGINPWHPPIMGFPPMTTMHHHPTTFRPLHVWGHPTMDLQSRMPMWPKQVVPTPSPPPPAAWTPPPPHPPPIDPAFWHSPHHRRFTAPPVPGIPPHAMYRPEHGVAQPQPGFDVHPSKESLDSAIGDVLAKPWLPLPIGLKPPSVDSVLVELQRQGVPKIPPSCA